MICIAYNEKGQPISIVNAESEKLAMAYWHGKGCLPFSQKTEKDFDYTVNGTGVVPILVTKEVRTASLDTGFDKKILTISN